ncbi:MAG: hypothetical protein CMB80_08125 [Flammeovirgaceae bacterium]|nr:hypothetical protein [Flammeovirgaceae bacterium]|tara:strand:- start:2621 stop:3052 length:432 start_codon:yes stop_codon:yes gene_type:complete
MEAIEPGDVFLSNVHMDNHDYPCADYCCDYDDHHINPGDLIIVTQTKSQHQYSYAILKPTDDPQTKSISEVSRTRFNNNVIDGKFVKLDHLNELPQKPETLDDCQYSFPNQVPSMYNGYVKVKLSKEFVTQVTPSSLILKNRN